MSKLTNHEIREHDIDWYCLVNQKPVHIASMGGMIPRSFRDRAKLRELQRKVAEMKPFTEAILNYDTVNRLITTGYEYLENGDIRQNISPREPINYTERELPLVSYVHDRRQRELEFKF